MSLELRAALLMLALLGITDGLRVVSVNPFGSAGDNTPGATPPTLTGNDALTIIFDKAVIRLGSDFRQCNLCPVATETKFASDRGIHARWCLLAGRKSRRLRASP
jgi:hypothetical protein